LLVATEDSEGKASLPVPTPEEIVQDILKNMPAVDDSASDDTDEDKTPDDEATATRKRLMKLLEISQKEIDELRRKAEAGELKEEPTTNRWISFDGLIYIGFFFAILYAIDHDYGLSPSTLFAKVLPREMEVVQQIFGS
jgi:hypothetical protein